MIYRRLGFFAAARDKGNVSSVWALVVRQVNFGRATMPHRQQFRTYAEYCLRLAELIELTRSEGVLERHRERLAPVCPRA